MIPVWNCRLLNWTLVSAHPHTSTPPKNANKHGSELDCIMPRQAVREREHSCTRALLLIKSWWINLRGVRQQRRNKRRNGERKREGRGIAALLPSKLWATLITLLSFSHEYWALVTVHEQRGRNALELCSQRLYMSYKYRGKTQLFNWVITLKITVIIVIVHGVLFFIIIISSSVIVVSV